MRLFVSALVGIVLAVAVAGFALLPLTTPGVTKVLETRFSDASAAGLSQQQSLTYAEATRAFVSDSAGASLPLAADGMTGYDDAAVSHLRDVRGVIFGARLATGVLAALLVVWLGATLATGRLDWIVTGLKAGAISCAVLVTLAVAASFANFDTFFAWFHSLFFSAGTWTFPADSLLIRLFPEQFWMAAGASWAALVLLGGALLWLAAVGVGAAEELRQAPGA